MRLSLIALSFAGLFVGTAEHIPGRQPARTDAVLQALEAEAARSMTGLSRAPRAPYYLGYTVWDRTIDVLTAGTGVTLVDRTDRQRLLDVDVRIGGYAFDNTRRLQGPQGGSGPASMSPLPVPTGNDVDALRAAVWLRTDREYRAAAERIVQVEGNRAATTAIPDTSGDFSKEPPVTLIEDVPTTPPVDRAVWGPRVKRVSARFDSRADIDRSSVTVRAGRDIRYLVNTEGTRVRTWSSDAVVTMSVTGLSADGTPLSASRLFQASTVAKLPSEATLLAAADSLIAELDALRKAPEVEPYTGPAILSGRASAVFFHEIFGHRIEGHRQKDQNFAQTFTNKVGEAVLPTFLTVSDDPTLRDFEGVELAGHYRVDDEGVTPRPTKLIENGVLSGFLMSRTPIQAALNSNGHGRRSPGYDVVARQGNLMISSTKTVPSAQLRALLIEEIKKQNKPYGLRFEEVEGGFTFTGRLTPQSFKVLPIKVYRVYADGRPDQLVRGVDMVGTPLTVFAKIIATDDKPGVFNGVCGAESGSVPVSAVSPALLISEIEIEKKAKTTESKPTLAPPSATVRQQSAAARPGSDIILDALGDELKRSMDSLRLPGLARPHFMAYRVDDEVVFTADGFLGDLISENTSRSRQLEADLRVGTAQMDNTNYLGGGGGYGWMEIGFEDNYDAIRRFAWRIADSKYRPAAEQLTQKMATLRGRPAPEKPSFVADSVRTMIMPALPMTLDGAPWSALVKRVSAVFRDFPAIENSRVRVTVQHSNNYLLTSEGTRARTPEMLYELTMFGVARGPGGPIRDYRVFTMPSARAFPSADAIVAAARELATELTQRAKASTIESYTGPVLLEGPAAPQAIQALFGRYLAGTAAPVSSDGLASIATQSRRLEPLVGQRVLATGVAVIDDPTRTEIGGVPLLGRYAIDDEGVIPQRVEVVANGFLRGFLYSRTPGRYGDRSTGHARSSGYSAQAPMVSNLIVQPSAPMTTAQLRAELLKLAQVEGFNYGLIVRRIEDTGLLPSRRGRGRSCRRRSPFTSSTQTGARRWCGTWSSPR
jgi:TldD protein